MDTGIQLIGGWIQKYRSLEGGYRNTAHRRVNTGIQILEDGYRKTAHRRADTGIQIKEGWNGERRIGWKREKEEEG